MEEEGVLAAGAAERGIELEKIVSDEIHVDQHIRQRESYSPSLSWT
jgi:hypothetical protein